MARTLDHPQAAHPADEPQVRAVDVLAPFTWLRRGASDLRRSLRHSLGWGLAVAAAGLLILGASAQAAYLAPALLGGFLLVAPFAAIVLYGISRQLERGDAIDVREARSAWRANGESIALFGLMLAVALIFWERVAAIVFASFYRGEPLHVARLAGELLSGGHAALLVAFVAAGAIFAAAVFALSVVSAPLLLDRPVDLITAVLTSVRCCIRNPAAMLLWAALIAVITAVGLATAMLGLVVAFPWLAHASWHAYRELVE